MSEGCIREGMRVVKLTGRFECKYRAMSGWTVCGPSVRFTVFSCQVKR